MARIGFRQGYFAKRRRRVVLTLAQNQYAPNENSSTPTNNTFISENEVQRQEESLLEEQSRFLEEIAVNSANHAVLHNHSSNDASLDDIDPFLSDSSEFSESTQDADRNLEKDDEEIAAFPYEGIGLNTIRELVQQDEPVVWAFLGDENTLGVHASRDQRNFVDLFGERLRWELRRFPDVIINAGLPNADSAKCLEHAEERCFRFRPDSVFIMTGIHDAISGEEGLSSFKKNLVRLISKVSEANATPVLQTPCCISYEAMNAIPALPAYVDTIREVAERADIPLIDHWSLTEQSPEPSFELNDSGHKKVAANLLHELDLFDSSSDVCRTLS